MSDRVEPFRLVIPEAALDDLRERLSRTRWPEAETAEGWAQGVPLASIRALCEYWRDGYDWRRCEAALNGWGQFRTTIDGLGFHVRSPERDALPMVMGHGWPGSIVEFAKVIGPLADPAAHGGDPRDAFHLVLPSMPGFGFSDKPSAPGWKAARIARAWAALMDRLGYGGRFVAQGGNWDAVVATALARAAPPGCLAAHLNTLSVRQPPGGGEDPAVQAALAERKRFRGEMGYAQLQSTRPQTLGYGLADSPRGGGGLDLREAAAWSDHGGDLDALLNRDEILDAVMLYWLPNAGASSARLYWESLADAVLADPVELPVGVSQFPADMAYAPRPWAERYLRRIVHWNEPAWGGHFAALEQPALFVDEVRQCFRAVRRGTL